MFNSAPSSRKRVRRLLSKRRQKRFLSLKLKVVTLAAKINFTWKEVCRRFWRRLTWRWCTGPSGSPRRTCRLHRCDSGRTDSAETTTATTLSEFFQQFCGRTETQNRAKEKKKHSWLTIRRLTLTFNRQRKEKKSSWRVAKIFQTDTDFKTSSKKMESPNSKHDEMRKQNEIVSIAEIWGEKFHPLQQRRFN